MAGHEHRAHQGRAAQSAQAQNACETILTMLMFH
jgi:hypothetical protein